MIDRLLDISNGALLGVCVLWAIYFLTPTHDDVPKRLRKWTGVLMLVIGAQTLLCVVCSFLIPNQMEDVGASVTVNLLAIPFAVFMMMELTRLCRVTLRRVATHLCIPVLLAAVYVVQLLCYEPSAGSSTLQWRDVTFLLYCIWIVCYASYYIYRFAVAAHRYEEVVGDIYADVEGRSINWLRRVLGIVFGIIAVFVIMLFQLDDHWTWVAYNVWAGLFLMALCRNISLMRDNEAIDTTEVPPVESEPAEQTLADDEQSDIISSLRVLMVERNLYQQPNLTRETAARALDTNHNELTRRIKSETGMTFSQFVTSIRLEHAAELLTSTSMTVDEILYSCGFRSSSTFYRQFAERYLCSPIEYRQRSK